MPWLTGDEIPVESFCRIIRVPNDPVFIQAVSGALLDLTYPENWEKLGELTPNEQAAAFDETYINFTKSKCFMMPVGATMIWHTNAPPTRWLLCTGGAAYVADYPELFALWGYKYGASGDQFGLPDMSDFIPMGTGGLVSLDDTTGEAEHTLTIPEMPAHTHPPLAPSTTFLGNKPSATNTMPASNQIGTAATTGSTGGGLSHNNIPPVFGVNFIVYGGE